MKSFKIPVLIIALALLSACTAFPQNGGEATPTGTNNGDIILTWERVGGIAGFCDKVVIHAPGWADVENCKGSVQTRIELTEGQRAQLKEWQQTFLTFEFDHTDPAVADAMTIKLSLAGNGTQTPDDDAINIISQFAADIATQANFDQNAPPEANEAKDVLRDYLTALNRGDYILGAKLYGGSPELLHTWNPDIADDLPALFERACTQNGLVCLEPLSIAYRGIDENGNYLFRVEFKNADGSLFRLGPCCGEENGVPVTDFIYRVVRTASGYAVLDLPPFMP